MKKRKMSKVLAAVVALSMLVPATAFASNSGVTIEKVVDGELRELSTTGTSYETPSKVKALETKYGLSYNAKNLKNLTIGSGVEKVGYCIFSPTYNSVPNLETVTMEDVEVIEEFAFSGLEHLKSVTLADELREIKGAAFENTLALKSINLPDGLEVIGEQAFRQSGLTSVEIPGTVKKIGAFTFGDDYSLTKVVINDGVETIEGGAFENCPRLAEIHIPASVKTMAVGVFSKGSVFSTLVYTPKGSYAEGYCKNLGMKIANADVGSTTPATKPTAPTAKPDNTTEFRGFKPVEGLVGTTKEYIEFGLDYGGDFKSHEYDIQIWNDDTKVDYVSRNSDYCEVDTGYLIKMDGKYYAANGMITAKLADSVGTVESKEHGVWNYDI